MMAKIGEWLSKSLALNKASYNTIEALLKALTYSADPNMPGHLMNSDAAVSQIGLSKSV